MVPLRPEAREHLAERLGLAEEPGLLALRHALRFARPGLWGDDPLRPGSLVLLRDAGGHREAFAAGQPGPAAAWLGSHPGAILLAAPESWTPWVESAVGPVEHFESQTLFDPPPRDPAPPARVPARRLGPADDSAFAALVPDWALRGWGSFEALVTHGAGFGIAAGPDGPAAGRLAAAAWTFDASDRFDALAVFTAPAYRRLGLARAAARALLAHVHRTRGRRPLWSTDAGNVASLGLARALGFRGLASQPLLRWHNGPTPPEPGAGAGATLKPGDDGGIEPGPPDDWSRL